MAILIKDGIILTINRDNQVLNKGSLLIEEDRIIDLGLTEEVLERQADRPYTIFNAEGKIVLPGFVSVHNHLGYTVFRGRAEDVGAKPTPSLFLPAKQIITKIQRKAFAALGGLETLLGGVTTILEMEEDADVIAPFLEQLGIRAGLAIMANDVDVAELMGGKTVFDASLRQQQLQQTIDLIETWHKRSNQRFTAFVAANMALSCSVELLKSLRQIADQYSLGLTYHVGLGAYEVELIQKLYHCRPFELASKVGFLCEEAILAHCHYMNEEDLKLLAKSKATVAHCPVLNSLRAASAPVHAMRQLKIPIALGLDNYFADYYDVMRACIAVARVKSQDATYLSAREALRFATIDAAKAMGLGHEIGSLEVGKKADIQIVNTARPGLCPITDPCSSLVYHAHASDVDTVMVDGQILVAAGKALTVNEQAIYKAAQSCADELWKSFAKTYPHLKLSELETHKPSMECPA